MTNSENICVAEIKSAYGIKGWVWLYSHTEPMQAVFDYQPLFIVDENNNKVNLSVEQWRKQGKGLVAKLSNVPDRNAAENVANTKIWLAKKDLPAANNNEFYWSDLVGMKVVSVNETTSEQDTLGVIKQLFETTAHQIMEVQPTAESADDETRLIPWHETTVVDVDVDNKIVITSWQLDY